MKEGFKLGFVADFKHFTLFSSFQNLMLYSGSKVMYPNYYENKNKSCTFLFLADWAVRAVLKISSILLNNTTFEHRERNTKDEN